jgi:hypothetical protein
MYTLLRKLGFSFGLVGIGGALAIVAGQCVSWFELDYWPDVSVLHGLLALGWRVPTTTSPGFTQVMNLITRIPLSIAVLFVGILLKYVFQLCANQFSRKQNNG